MNWWHGLEGGPIAEDRPPPPNADAPYRPLGDAPTGAPPADPARRAQIAEALVADRANAQYAASLQPLPAPAATPPRPTPPKPQAASPDSSNASLAAATAPPPPPAPAPARPVARAAPATPVQSAPLPPPGPAAETPVAPAPAAAPAAELPPIAEQPPPPPRLEGVPEATAATPPPPTPKPPPPPPPPAPVAGAPVSIAFAPGSATLPSAALPALKQIARSRGAGLVAIAGFGEAKSASPDAQQAAMPLAMGRVRAVAAYLLEAGVPSAALRIDGQAQGTGAVARILQ